MGKLLEAMFTYEGLKVFGCAWFFFSLFVDFFWSERVVNGLFVVCLDLEMWSIACILCVWWLMEDKDGM